MARFNFSFLRALRPRFCWWSGNVWDIRSLLGAVVVLAFFLPILPWEGRKKGNYSLTENIHSIAEAANREMLDIESINARYEKEIPDTDLRECVIARNVILTFAADSTAMMGEMRSAGMSNVPAVFVYDSVLNSVFDAIALPDLDSVLVDVAKKCQKFPNAYLKVEDVENLKSKPLPRAGFWEYWAIEDAQESQ